MDKPLNIKLDEEIIAFAKKYAKSKGMSLSKYLEQHFRELYQNKKYDLDFLKENGISEADYNQFNEEFADKYGIKEGKEKDILRKKLRDKNK